MAGTDSRPPVKRTKIWNSPKSVTEHGRTKRASPALLWRTVNGVVPLGGTRLTRSSLSRLKPVNVITVSPDTGPPVGETPVMPQDDMRVNMPLRDAHAPANVRLSPA